MAKVKIFVGEGISNCPPTIPAAAVAYTLSMPCTPVCELSLPECLDKPLILIADIAYDDISIYDMTPVSTVTMDGTSVTFEISDTWVDTSTIDTVQVSFTTSNGAPTCTTYKAVGDGFTIGPITAVCSGGMTNVVIVVYSEDIIYESTIIPEACSRSPTGDTCTYEFVILC
jgi:hypothetical protein